MEPPNSGQSVLCLFCYKTTNFKDNQPDLRNANYERFFSLIARYFLNGKKNLISDEEQEWWMKNACKVISELNSSSDGDGDKPSTNLIICETCQLITEKWCELYDKVKELELLMDWEISKLGNVMRFADLDEVTCQKGGKILEECSASHELPIEDLRKSLKQSFQAYLEERRKESFPRLSLSPVKSSSDLNYDPRPRGPSVKMEDADTGTDCFYHDGLDQNEAGMLEEDLVLETGSTTTPATIITIKRKGQPYQRKRKLLKVNQGQDPTCPSCGKIFKEGHLLRSHQSLCHPEVFFREIENNCKISVQNTLKKMLDTDFTKLKISSEEKGGKAGNFRFKCGFCSRILQSRTNGKSHLILRHRKNVEEQLVNLANCGEDETLNEKSFKCDYCSDKPLQCFKDNHKLFQHLITHHLDKYFENGKMDNNSDEKFNEYLRWLFKLNVEDVWGRDTKGKCGFCEVICSGRRSAKSHLILKHFQILRDELVGLQKKFGEDGPPLPVPVPKKVKTIKKVTKLKRMTSGPKDNKCGSCGMVWKDLRYHQSQKHPEQLFLPEKFSKISVEYVLERQVEEGFRKIVEVGKKISRRKGWSPYRFKCEICGNVLHRRGAARSHLVLVHLEVMREKLGGLGKSGRGMEEIREELEKIQRERFGRPKDLKERRRKKGEGEEVVVWKCEGEGGGCGRGFSRKDSLERHRERSCEMLWIKRGKRRGIRNEGDLKVEVGGDGVLGESELVEVDEGIVKREQFESEEGEGRFVIFPEMEEDGDGEDGEL